MISEQELRDTYERELRATFAQMPFGVRNDDPRWETFAQDLRELPVETVRSCLAELREDRRRNFRLVERD